MKFSVIFFIGMLLLSTSGFSKIQDTTRYNYNNKPKTFRINIGVTQISITGLDTFPNRVANAIYFNQEMRILSKIKEGESKGFTVYDALYYDICMGKMKSKKLDDMDSRFSALVHLGYLVLPGFRNERLGIMGGINIQVTKGFIGGISPVYKFTGRIPFIGRLEFRPAFGYEFRVVATVWDNFNDKKNSRGIRIDIPLAKSKRIFFTFEKSIITNVPVELPFFPGSQVIYNGNLNQVIFGLRFGSIY